MLLHAADQVTVRRNKFTGPFSDYAVLNSSTYNYSATYSYNIIDCSDNSADGIYFFRATSGFVGNVYNNLILNCKIGLSTDNYASSVRNVENNIFYNNTTHVKVYSGSFTLIDYNLYYGAGNWKISSTTDTTFTKWKADSSQDRSSLNSDPLFISASDYHLQWGSPARWAGTGVSLTTDYDGNPVHSPPSMGAYEYMGVAPNPNPPKSLRFVP